MAGDDSELNANLTFDPISDSDIQDAYAIETESYPSDEAATLAAFIQRQSQAPDLFFGAYIQDRAQKSNNTKDRKLIGYICSTLSPSTTLTHASMTTHDPNGTTVCIHSVCVAAPYRRRGVGTRLLKEYLSRLQKAQDTQKSSQKYDRVLLIAHEDLRTLYEGAGFDWVGPSPVVHGSRPWFEMRKLLDGSSAPIPTASEPGPGDIPAQTMTTIPPDIMQALQSSFASSSRRPRPIARLLSDPASMDEILTVTAEEGGTKVNKYDLLCPRPGCGCLILKSGAGRLVEQEIINQEVLASQSQAPSLSSATANVPCWIVEPTPMVFENMGFSKSVPQSTDGPKMKYLICADCDHGSLGWTFEGETRYWVICSRVGYKAQDA